MTVNLICLPFAGAGAGFFFPWRKFCSEDIELCALQLPGRERRIREAPFRDVRVAADTLAHEVAESLAPEPTAVFGHSLGAVLGYELTRRLLAMGKNVTHLFVSGAGPPISRKETVYSIDDERLLARVERLTGYRHPAFEDPELRELLIPTLRADVEMHERYRPTHLGKIDAEVVALRGERDELVHPDEVAQWSVIAGGCFRQIELPGGHMYLVDYGRTVVELIRRVCLGEPIRER